MTRMKPARGRIRAANWLTPLSPKGATHKFGYRQTVLAAYPGEFSLFAFSSVRVRKLQLVLSFALLRGQGKAKRRSVRVL